MPPNQEKQYVSDMVPSLGSPCAECDHSVFLLLTPYGISASHKWLGILLGIAPSPPCLGLAFILGNVNT